MADLKRFYYCKCVSIRQERKSIYWSKW